MENVETSRKVPSAIYEDPLTVKSPKQVYQTIHIFSVFRVHPSEFE